MNIAIGNIYSKAVAQWRSVNKVALEISQNSQMSQSLLFSKVTGFVTLLKMRL